MMFISSPEKKKKAKKEPCQPRLLYPEKLSLTIKGEIKPSKMIKTKQSHDH
jgi:hypothetical protein